MPTFCFLKPELHKLAMPFDLNATIEQVVTGLGYDLVDVELSNRGKMLRVFIDTKFAPGKSVKSEINVNDCQKVSHQLTAVFAVEDVDYDRLEISSPGVDRPLRKQVDFERFAGEEAAVKFRLNPTEKNQRNYIGVLGVAADGSLTLSSEGMTVPLDPANVEKAKLVPKLDFQSSAPEKPARRARSSPEAAEPTVPTPPVKKSPKKTKS